MIRVFSVPEGLRLFEFRRGMKRYSDDDSKLSVNREDTLILQKEKMRVGGVCVNCGMCESVFLPIFLPLCGSVSPKVCQHQLPFLQPGCSVPLCLKQYRDGAHFQA